jgi:tryptophanyl-tRNA synthetase
MAADILLYKGTHVPVGDDQKQHLELARDIAQKFNNDFGKEVFPLPEPMIFGSATRVMSLRDGTKKMSKSDPSEYSRIGMTDDADTIAKKVRKAKTDPHPVPDSVEACEDRPEAKNLMNIFAALSDKELKGVCGEFGGQSFADFKKALTDLAVDKLAPISEEMQRYMDDPAEVDAILRDGAERANALAQPVLEEVKDVIGFLRP